jgi:hypothetical protein
MTSSIVQIPHRTAQPTISIAIQSLVPQSPFSLLTVPLTLVSVGQGFQILFYMSEVTTLGIAFVGRTDPKQYDIVCTATVIHDFKTQKDLIIIISQAAYIPETSQVESLLHADQARHHHVIVNDIAQCYFDSCGKPG